MAKNSKVKSLKAYKRKKRNKNKGKAKILILVASIAVGNLCIYQVSSSLKYDIYYLKKDLKKKQIKLEQLQVENIGNANLKKLEEDAMSRLNMIYPTESQKRYITVDN